MVCLSSITIFAAQENKSKTVNTDSTLSQLLSSYYDIKNSLVNGDESAAATNATTFIKKIKAVDTKILSSTEQKAFNTLKEKLVFDAEHIAESEELNHQRGHFASLSLNISTLAKAVKLSTQPVYQEYCPMKKAYWLSSESAIKNPYYGNAMLTCGKVSDTIK